MKIKKLLILILSIACVSFAVVGCSNDSGLEGAVGGGGKPVYAEVVYTWSSDHLSCTAYLECLSNAELSVTETKQAQILNEQPGNCYQGGILEVVVYFDNPEIKYQQRTFETPIVHSNVVDILAVEPTCFNDGFTAGQRCASCNTFIVKPAVIPTTVTHEFINGHCNKCNTDTFTSGLKFFEYMTQGELYVTKDGEGTIELGSNEVVIPAIYNGMPVVGICDFTFENSNIVSIEIPESVTDIGMYAFRGCTNLATVNIPSGVTQIDASTFSGCASLEEIIIPKGVTEIGGQAFSGTALKTLVLPDTVTSIGMSAFATTERITDLYINGDLNKYINVNAYRVGNTISYGTLPMAKNLYSWHMNGDITIAGVKYDPVTEFSVGGDPNLDNILQGMFKGVETLKLVQIGQMNGGAEIVVEGDAFRDCPNLERVILLDNVSTVGYYAFAGCTSLTELTLSGVSIIQNGAFDGTTSLKGVSLPDTVIEVWMNAFYNSGIKYVNIPRYLSVLGQSAFQNCVNLEKVTSASYYYNNDTNDRRPQDTVLTTLDFGVFSYCTNLEYIVLPKSITKIENQCFKNSGLKTIYFTGTQTEYNAITLGEYAMPSTAPTVYYYSQNKYTGGWYYQSNGTVVVA